VCGVISGAAAFRNGALYAQGDHIAALMFGAAGVAIVCMSWFLPARAAEHWRERAWVRWGATVALWIVTAGFTLIQSAGFAAFHRTETVNGKAEAIRRHDEAKARLARETAELEAMKASPRYAASAACADATAKRSLSFCAVYSAKLAEIEEARAEANRGAPGTPDAQAVTLSWITGLNRAWIEQGLPVLTAIVFELGAALAFFAASSPAIAKDAPKIEAVTLERVSAPEPGRPETPKAPARIKAAAPPPLIGFDGKPVKLPKARRKKGEPVH
jgi:hypothetical protein